MTADETQSLGAGSHANQFLTVADIHNLTSGEQTAYDSNVRFVFDQTGHTLYYDATGSGVGSAQQVVNVGAGSTHEISASDLWIVDTHALGSHVV